MTKELDHIFCEKSVRELRQFRQERRRIREGVINVINSLREGLKKLEPGFFQW